MARDEPAGAEWSRLESDYGREWGELTSVDATEDEEESENGDGVEVHGVKR